MPGTAPRLLRRLAGAAAASGLALAGLVLAAAPASAAACSGTSGVTVVVDTGSSVSTKCASGDPSSALKALAGAGFSVTYPQQFPGSVVCRINGFPASDPCVRMPPAGAYWAFFHAERGGSWTYSSNGVASHNPAPGTVVGFRFGSGQQPRVAPPEPTATSAPAPTTRPKATSTPKKTTAAPKPSIAPRTTAGSTPGTTAGSKPGSTASATARPSTASASATPSAVATASGSTSATASASGEATVAVAPVAASEPSDGAGVGTLAAGAAIVALVAGGAGFAAWKRRGAGR